MVKVLMEKQCSSEHKIDTWMKYGEVTFYRNLFDAGSWKDSI